MTFTPELLKRIESHGLKLSLEGQEIVISGNKAAFTQERRAFITQNKAELISLLQERDSAQQVSQDNSLKAGDGDGASSGAPSIQPPEAPSPLFYPCAGPGDRQQVLAVDLETTGLDPRVHHLRLVSFAGDQGAGVHETPEPLRDVLANPAITKVFHNAPFDVPWLLHHGYQVNTYEDTMLMEQVLCNGERRPKGGYGLQALVKKYFDLDIDKSLQGANNWDGFLFPEHYTYAQKDSEVTLLLYRHLRELLAAKGYQAVYSREARALPAIIRLQRDGMPFDAPAWREDLAGHRRKLMALDAEIKEVLPCGNLASPAQLLSALNGMGLHLEDTSDESLALSETLHPVLPLIRSWRAAQKLCTGFGEKLLEKVRDGRIYSSWRLIGATTGRMSCSGPNLQQVPRDLRRFFNAAPGHKLVVADYSQIELRIAAEVAGEQNMLEAFRKGEDLHRLTAQMITGRRDVTKEARQIAKACNFGLLYGMSAEGFRNYAEIDYGVQLTPEEAEDFKRRFFEAYPGLRSWHQKQSRSRVITTLGGRSWDETTLSSPLNKFNYPVQGTAAEGLKEALGLLVAGLPEEWKLCGVIHDEVVLETPEHDAERAVALLEKAMVEGMSTLVKEVPIVAEATVKDTWEK
ncbi:MAG: DNA polymerase [Candidatus Eremiobacteraeota bacterium]|nr:DNA polymerase [Candidatus Eremiobacteraeota bacterium]